VGDIVNSQGIDPDTDIRKRVTLAAQNVFDRINTNYIGSLMTTFGMVRGDAFEGVILTQYLAPQIVQDIIKAVYSVEKTTVRISVVLGQLTVTSDDRNMADGPAFHTAFANLEMLKKRDSTHWLQVSFDIGSLAQSLVDSQLALLTALTEGWTDKQREVVWAMESHGGRQKVVGKLLDIAPSVVSKQLKATKYDVYRQAWEGLADYLINMDEYTTADKPVIEKSYVPYFNVALHEAENQRNYEIALPIFQKSLELAKIELGESDPLLIPIYNNLARTCMMTRQYDDADRFVHKSLQLQKSLPKTRAHYAETLLIQAELSRDIKDFPKAKKLFQNALDIARDILSDSHPFVGDIYNSFAILYHGIGEFEKALKYYGIALAIEEKSIKEVNPAGYANTLHNIACCHFDVQNYNQSMFYAEEAYRLFKDNLPPNHSNTKRTQILMSDIEDHRKGATI